MSIRLRLTLLYTGIVALTLIAFTGAVYALTSRVTMDAAERALIAEAQRLGERPLADPGNFQYPPRQFAAPETYFQIRAADGTVVGKTTNLGDYDLPISSSGLQAVQSGQAWMEVTSTDNGRLLVYSRPVVLHGQFLGIVQVARPLADYDQSLGALERILIIGSLAVTAIAFGIGWLLAGTALRPIHHITETAQAIGAERDFSRRVEYSGPRDEIHSLARTFNTMLTELQSAYRQTEEALQAQRRFAADASHELRTPLTTIRGNLGLLQREPPIAAEDKVAALDDMVAETERLMRLVNDLLLLARADAKHPLMREAVPVAPVVDEVCRQVRLIAPERAIACDVQAEATIRGDRDALQQVLLILLDNAVKHTPAEAGIEVEAAVAATGPQSADRVVIRVRDHGPGIPEEMLPHVFERFFRADGVRSSTGAGLGLAIARALVEAQGGTIAVESLAGQGVTFTIQLPAAQ